MCPLVGSVHDRLPPHLDRTKASRTARGPDSEDEPARRRARAWAVIIALPPYRYRTRRTSGGQAQCLAHAPGRKCPSEALAIRTPASVTPREQLRRAHRAESPHHPFNAQQQHPPHPEPTPSNPARRAAVQARPNHPVQRLPTHAAGSSGVQTLSPDLAPRPIPQQLLLRHLLCRSVLGHRPRRSAPSSLARPRRQPCRAFSTYLYPGSSSGNLALCGR